MAKKKNKSFTDDDDALLDALGVETAVAKTQRYTAREERIIAGFEEIQRFYKEHGRLPKHGEGRDIFERLYAVRLDRIRESVECSQLLKELDSDGLLSEIEAVHEDGADYECSSDEELLKALGMEPAEGSDLTQLRHVRSRAEIRAAEEIARRTPCEDFDKFRPVFDQVQSDLDNGLRITESYQTEEAIGLGDLFIVEGNKTLVAELGKEFVDHENRLDRRLRLIYDNGTESNLLLRSLQKALWRDPAGRRIMPVGYDRHPLFTAAEKSDETPIFVDEMDADDETSGILYVLRSLSDHPFVAGNRELLHKIGFTRGELKNRFSTASSEPAFLMSDVEVVASYRVANASAGKLENVLHRFFASARIDVKLRDHIGGPVEPREWFLIPLPVIKKAIKLIRSGEIAKARYDLATAQIVCTHFAKDVDSN